MAGFKMYEFFGNPEAVKAHLQEHAVEEQRVRMEADELQHKINNLIQHSDFSEDQLRTLMSLIKICTHQPETANIWIGQIITTLESKFSVCAACGQNHSAPTPSAPAKVKVKEAAESDLDPTEWNTATARLENMREYDLVADPSPSNQIRVRCRKCGLHYVSLEDRMLREPGLNGCHGCQQKSATG